MKQAADIGNLSAQRHMGMACRLCQGDEEESAHYYTLAFSHKDVEDGKSECILNNAPTEEIIHAAHYLGEFYYFGTGGFSRNLYRAKYYFEEELKFNAAFVSGGFDPSFACFRSALAGTYLYLSACLMELHVLQYGCTGYNIPGYSPIPRVLTLYRKAVKGEDTYRQCMKGYDYFFKNFFAETCKFGGIESCNYSRLKGSIARLESLKNVCANCEKHHSNLNSCGRCRSTWYCGKACQTEHWIAGHKLDCAMRVKEASKDPCVCERLHHYQLKLNQALGSMRSSKSEEN
jgi:hypothetical protein